uniref:Melanopsin-A-like n=1 Tax=Cyprinodon variegatus TaxID=28743 RepID=A0A3Q2CQT6_CYPVA
MFLLGWIRNGTNRPSLLREHLCLFPADDFQALNSRLIGTFPGPVIDLPSIEIRTTQGAFVLFHRSRSLRTPANMFIINLAVTDLLMCITQSPIFFTTSMHKRWIFGEKGCELYAFCGALFGICSMITLMVIAIDRYFVITRPLTSIGVLSRKRALLILMVAWAYSLGWSLPPFFGWSAYVPEGLLTSCTWDYMTFTPSVRAYTMLLFIFVFFLPLFIIIYCYIFIFRAIRSTNQAVGKISGSTHSHSSSRDSVKTFHRLQNEWKMAKIALIVILLYVISWSPYSAVALTAFCLSRSLFQLLLSLSRFVPAEFLYSVSWSHLVDAMFLSSYFEFPEQSGDASEGHVTRAQIGRIPSIVITSETSPFLPIGRSGSRTNRAKASNNNAGAGPG